MSRAGPPLPGGPPTSIMAPPASTAASKLANVLPGAMWSAPLWPTRRSRGAIGMVGGALVLTSRAPVRRPVGVALAARHDRRAAPRARPAGVPVHTRLDGAVPERGRALHSRSHCLDDCRGFVVRDRIDTAPGIDPGLPAPLSLPDVPDPGDVALVEERITEVSRLVVAAEPLEEAFLVELGREHVRPERGEPLIEPRPRVRHQLEQRPVELHHLALPHPEYDPGAPRRAPPPPARAVDAPHADHAKVRVEHEVALETEEQVLAVGIDAHDRATCQPLGPAVERVAGLWRLDLVGYAPLEDGANPVGRVGDRVALGHYAPRVRRRGPCWNPSATSAGPSGDSIAATPSTFSSATRLSRPARTCSISAFSAGSIRASSAATSVWSARPPRSR